MTQREAHRDFAAHRVTNEGDRGFLCTSGPQFVGDQIGEQVEIEAVGPWRAAVVGQVEQHAGRLIGK